jgi:hypothetical protein
MEATMGLGVGIFMVAVGAILTWAVNVTTSGVDLQTVGVILMVVGAAGILLSMVFWSSWGGGMGRGRRTEITETTADPRSAPPAAPVAGQRTVRDEQRW